MSRRVARSDLESFRAALAQKAGLRFQDDKIPLLAEALIARMDGAGCQTVSLYLERLETDDDEVARLARILSVSETYFLRNQDQFRVVAAYLRERHAKGQRHVRALSAGCSSGEEPYSLAMIVRETLSNLEEWSVSITGVDLNPDVLEKARAATYAAWSLRETPDEIRRAYFTEKGKRYFVAREVRDMVRFERENLAQPSGLLWRPESLEIVFCRNVLMYFTPQAASGVVACIARALVPGGLLFLGHAENLRGLSHDFHLRHSHDTFYYERKASTPSAVVTKDGRDRTPTKSEPRVAANDGSWFETIAQATSRIERLSQEGTGARVQAPARDGAATAAPSETALTPAMDLMEKERFEEALRLLSSVPSGPAPEPDALLLRAMLLVSTGEPAEAERVCAELLAVDDLNAGAHYIMALTREHAGDRVGSVEHSQTAAYLDPDFAMAHLQLGRLARRAGDLTTARRELQLALGLLPREDAARVVLFGGGFGRDTLLQVCRSELEACGEEQ